jgi:hypothetical protein
LKFFDYVTPSGRTTVQVPPQQNNSTDIITVTVHSSEMHTALPFGKEDIVKAVMTHQFDCDLLQLHHITAYQEKGTMRELE